MLLFSPVFTDDTRKSSETSDFVSNSMTRLQSLLTSTGNWLAVVCILTIHFERKEKVEHNIFLAFLVTKVTLQL